MVECSLVAFVGIVCCIRLMQEIESRLVTLDTEMKVKFPEYTAGMFSIYVIVILFTIELSGYMSAIYGWSF